MIDCDWCRDPIAGVPARTVDRGRPVHLGDCAAHADEHEAVYVRARVAREQRMADVFGAEVDRLAAEQPRGLTPDLIVVDDPWLPAAAVELDGPRQQGRSYLAGGLVGDGGPGLAWIHPGEQYLTAEQAAAAVAAIRPAPMPPAARDQLRRQIARAFDVPFVDVDPAAMRAELGLRGAELDRWCDDGGPAVDLERTLPPLVVEIRPDATAFFEAMRAAAVQVRDVFTRLAEAFVNAGRQLARAFGIAGPASLAARRWVGDVPPQRWRDWLPAAERKVDRARREHLDRQLRTLARRAARRRRIRTRKAAGWYAVARAGRHGAAGLDVLRTAADGAR